MSAALESILTPELRAMHPELHQHPIPALAKTPDSVAQVRGLLARVETTHEVVLGDAREIRLPPSSVHLVVTSPPYWTLKKYPDSDGQIGRLGDYEDFLDSLKHVWGGCFDALVPGGRLVCVVGDV